jgi:hypothetical protein
MSDDMLLPFDFPAIGRKKLTAAFDGGRITSDGGLCCWPPPSAALGLPSDWPG